MNFRIIIVVFIFLCSCSKKKSEIIPEVQEFSILDRIAGTYKATKLSFDNVDKELSDTQNRGVIKIFLSARANPNIDISNYWQNTLIKGYTTDITLKKIDSRVYLYISEKEIGYVIDEMLYINYVDQNGTLTEIEAVRQAQ